MIAGEVLGVLFYVLVEEHANGEDWTVVEAYYFVLVTISTVGYGDYSPSSDGSRWFTVIYALIGISITFSLLGSVVDELMLGLQRVVIASLSRAMQACHVTRAGKGSQAAAEEAAPTTEIEPAWQVFKLSILKFAAVHSS